MAGNNKVTVDLTTGIGTLSFPRVFRETAGKKDDGTPTYDIQILIPKSDTKAVRDLLAAIKEVGEAKWGTKWTKVRSPLRDGDEERDELCEDGVTTRAEKYPERLGHYFLNARSGRPVGVVDRDRVPITDPSEVYGGCKGRLSLNFYAYTNSGNSGIGAGLNGVQKIANGEPFGGGAPSVDAMFDDLPDDLDTDLDSAEESKPKKGKKGKKKKS